MSNIGDIPEKHRVMVSHIDKALNGSRAMKDKDIDEILEQHSAWVTTEAEQSKYAVRLAITEELKTQLEQYVAKRVRDGRVELVNDLFHTPGDTTAVWKALCAQKAELEREDK